MGSFSATVYTECLRSPVNVGKCRAPGHPHRPPLDVARLRPLLGVCMVGVVTVGRAAGERAREQQSPKRNRGVSRPPVANPNNHALLTGWIRKVVKLPSWHPPVLVPPRCSNDQKKQPSVQLCVHGCLSLAPRELHRYTPIMHRACSSAACRQQGRGTSRPTSSTTSPFALFQHPCFPLYRASDFLLS